MASPNTQPLFIGTPFLTTVRLTNQTLTLNGITGTPVLLLTAGPYGAIIETLHYKFLGDEPANVVRVFRATATGYDIVADQDHANITGISNTQDSAPVIITLMNSAFPEGTVRTNLFVSPNESIYVALGTASSAGGYVVTAKGGHFHIG